MSSLINMPRAVWKRQPQVPVRIDYGKDLSKNILAAILPAKNINVVNQKLGETSGALFTTFKPEGVGLRSRSDIEALGQQNHTLNPISIGTGGFSLCAMYSGIMISTPAFTVYGSSRSTYFGLTFVPYSGAETLSLNLTSGAEFSNKLFFGTHHGGGVNKSFVDGVNIASVSRLLDFGSLASPFAVCFRNGANNTKNINLVFAAFWNRCLSDQEVSEVSKNPWQLFTPISSQFYLIPSGNIAYNMASTLQSESSVNNSSLNVVRALTTTLVNQSSTSASAANVIRNLQSALNSLSTDGSITLTVVSLIALLSSCASVSETSAAAANVQRSLLSNLGSQSTTPETVTLTATTVVALISAVASGSLSATAACAVARALSSVLNSSSTTTESALSIQRLLSTAQTSLSSTSISALELANVVALASLLASQSSTSEVTVDLAKALVSSVLSASETAAISMPILREFSSALVSVSLSETIDLYLAVLGQIELVSLIQSTSLSTVKARLLAEWVEAIQSEMKLQMSAKSPLVSMFSSGSTIQMH
jgi:hypothetical protein